MDLFVYGSLRHLPLFDAVAGAAGAGVAAPKARPARLADHAVDRVSHSRLPMLLARPGAEAHGTLWTGLTAAQRARLDLYEVAFGYDVRRVTVSIGSGAENPGRDWPRNASQGGVQTVSEIGAGAVTEVVAEAYFPPPGQLSSGEPWSLEAWRAADAAAALLACREIDDHDPPLSGPALFRQWIMMQARAEAKVRAAVTDAPATLRHPATEGDFSLAMRQPLVGDFFKLARVAVDHRTFADGRSGVLSREVLVGCDAALVLPYDAARDRVLLVEQFRTGPAVRHDPNPWSLEPVAGIVDPGETPEEAAVRETGEEAGLELSGLKRMFSIYPSPGSSTDHFHCFLGQAELTSREAGFGGLEDESEDLRLHVLPLDDAIALIDTGEITAGPLVAMLLWLDRYRARMRSDTDQ